MSTRPGLKQIPITGLPNGAVLGYGTTQFPAQTGWMVIGNTVYGFDNDAGGAAFAYTGTLGVTPTAPVVGLQSGPTFLYLTVQGDTTYVVDLPAKTVTAMANAPGGKVISLYNDRLVIANQGGTHTNRVSFSDPFAPGGTPQFPFPASEDFFDVGDAWDVNYITVQRSHMLIGKQTGWWIYQGEPGLNASLRQAITTPGPKEPLHAMTTASGLVWYMPLFTDAPTEFNGSTVAQLRNLRITDRKYVESLIPPAYGVSPLTQLNDVVFVAGHAVTGAADRMAELHNGAWAFHRLGVPVSGFIATGTNGLYLCDGGGVSAAGKVFVYNNELDRPVKAGDSGTARFGDASDTCVVSSIDLPEWEARDGSEVVVRAVMVGFEKWNTGAAQSNHFDMTVTSTRQTAKAGNTEGGQSQTLSWDEDPSEVEFDGQYHQVTFKCGAQGSGNGFKLQLSNLRGVAIAKIQVLLDQMDTRA